MGRYRPQQGGTLFTQNNILMLVAVATVVAAIPIVAFLWWAKQDREARVQTIDEWQSADLLVRSAERDVKDARQPGQEFLLPGCQKRLKEAEEDRTRIEQRSQKRWGKHPKDL